MPEVIDAGELTLRSILTDHRASLEIWLLQSDPLEQQIPNLADQLEATFPGYRRGTLLNWKESPDLADVGGVWIDTKAHFVASTITTPHTVNGFAVVAAIAETPPIAVHFGRLRPAITFGSERQAVLLQMSLQLATITLNGETHDFLMGFHRADSWEGGQPVRRLSGFEKKCAQACLASLENLLKRDSTLRDMTKRSKRCQVPLIAQGDTELRNGVSLLRARLQLLLDL